MSNLQLWGGGLTVVGLSPVLTSRAIIDDADATHTPCWGRVFSISAQPMGLLPSSFRVTLWSRTATWHWNVHHFPSYMPSGKKWKSKSVGFTSGKYNLDVSGCTCSLFKYITQQRDLWWHHWEQYRCCEGIGARYYGSGGTTQSFDSHRLFLKLCDQEAKTPSFDSVYSLFPA